MGRRGHEVSSFLGGGWSTVGLCHPVLPCDLLAAPLLTGSLPLLPFFLLVQTQRHTWRGHRMQYSCPAAAQIILE